MRYLAFLLVIGCTEPHTPTQQTTPARSAEPQIEHGRQLYSTASCSDCHGDVGEGTPDGPALIGEGALPIQRGARDVVFRSAADVLAWAMRTMPKDNPASLATDQYLAIVAFMITANGIVLDHPLDAVNAHAIALYE